MSEAAKAFLDSLAEGPRAKALHSFDDQERMNWFYTPVARKGLALKEMTSTQRTLAFALLSAGLSQRGYIKALTIISLEEILHVLEGGEGPVRDPDLYFFTIFGEPAEAGTWGWRMEGHHVSQNFTIVNGRVVCAPSFFGANPALVREGTRRGLRTLAQEEDLARALIHSMDPGQRQAAVVQKTAYADILTSNSRRAALDGEPSGLKATRMKGYQHEMLGGLLDEYMSNMPQQIADVRHERVVEAGDDIYFAWAGGLEAGEPHYYRIQSSTFLVEYDDTQNDANHIHSVWRDFDGDFGRDLLKEHYQSSHAKL
jgi:hypothetical protein